MEKCIRLGGDYCEACDFDVHLFQIGFSQLQNEFGYFQNELRFFRWSLAIYKMNSDFSG